MFPNALAGIDPDQLNQMLAHLTGQAAAPPGDAADNPFRRAADQGATPEVANLPPEQLDQAIASMKASPAGGGDAKTPSAVADSPIAQMARQGVQLPQPAQAQAPAAKQAAFTPYSINTSAPGTIEHSVMATNPNEEIAALLKQQYNTGFSDFMGAGSPFGPEHDERLKTVAASLGQNRANMFGDLYNQNQARQFQGGQNDANRTFTGGQNEADRVLRTLLADKQGANTLAVQGLQNKGAMDVEGLRGQNALAVSEQQDKQSMNADRLSTQAYMQSYAASLQSGKDPVSADAAARQVAANVRMQAGGIGKNQQGGGVAIPAGQYADLGGGRLVPLGPNGQPLPGAGAGGGQPAGGGPTAQSIGRIDSLFTSAKPLLMDKDGKPRELNQDVVNQLTDQIMAMKPTEGEAGEFARRIKAGELGDPAKFEAALAQQAAGNTFLAQPPPRDKGGAYPGQYQIPNLFTLRTNPNGGLGARTAAGIQNIATGGLPSGAGMGLPFMRSNGIPYNEVVLPGGRVLPFNPAEFQSMGGELGGSNAQKKAAAQNRAAYQSQLLNALLGGGR